VGLQSRALKASTVPGYIHLGGGQGFVTPPSSDITIVSPWDNGRPVRSISTAEDALAYPAFYAGVRLLSESVGRLPLVLYRRTGRDERERMSGTKLYRVLHDDFNAEMTALNGKATMMGHVILRGNAYAEKEYDDLGRITGLWPLRPDRMAVLRDRSTGRKFYRYTLPDGEQVDLTAEQIFHVPGFGYDGYIGYSVVSLFRRTLELGLSAEEFANRFFKSGGMPATVVHHPAAWGDPKVAEFSRKLRSNYQGLTNAQRIAILEEGVTWEAVGMNHDDAQMLETRAFQKGEAATILNIPPHMLQDVSKSTSWGTGIEEQTLGFVTFSLGGWLDRYSAETNRQLVRPSYTSAYAEFLLEALLKSRPEDRARYYQALWSMGVLNPETIARKENLPAPDQGGTYYVPVNYQPVEAAAVPEDDEERAARTAAGTKPVTAADLARELTRSGATNGNGNGNG
jgi:HK97 family phage portal protein